MERDRYFTADQALEYGLIDRIVTSRDLSRVAAGFGAQNERRHLADSPVWDNPGVAGRVRGTGAAALASAGAASFGLWQRLLRRPLPKTRGSLAVRGVESR